MFINKLTVIFAKELQYKRNKISGCAYIGKIINLWLQPTSLRVIDNFPTKYSCLSFTYQATSKICFSNTNVQSCMLREDHEVKNLRQIGLEGAVECSGFHMLWNDALGPEDMECEPFSRWAQVLVNFFVSLYKIYIKNKEFK